MCGVLQVLLLLLHISISGQWSREERLGSGKKRCRSYSGLGKWRVNRLQPVCLLCAVWLQCDYSSTLWLHVYSVTTVWLQGTEMRLMWASVFILQWPVTAAPAPARNPHTRHVTGGSTILVHQLFIQSIIPCYVASRRFQQIFQIYCHCSIFCNNVNNVKKSLLSKLSKTNFIIKQHFLT